MLTTSSPPSGSRVKPSPIRLDKRPHVNVSYLGALCKSEKVFEYVPLPSVLVPVTVTTPLRSEEDVFSASENSNSPEDTPSLVS